MTHRLAQLIPDDPTQRRDLGVLLVQAGQPGRAIDHLRHYLTADPGAEDARDVQKFLAKALTEVARWNSAQRAGHPPRTITATRNPEG